MRTVTRVLAEKAYPKFHASAVPKRSETTRSYLDVTRGKVLLKRYRVLSPVQYLVQPHPDLSFVKNQSASARDSFKKVPVWNPFNSRRAMSSCILKSAVTILPYGNCSENHSILKALLALPWNYSGLHRLPLLRNNGLLFVLCRKVVWSSTTASSSLTSS